MVDPRSATGDAPANALQRRHASRNERNTLPLANVVSAGDLSADVPQAERQQTPFEMELSQA
jgi:hypothetical protein